MLSRAWPKAADAIGECWLRNVRSTGLVRVLVVDDDEAVRNALTHALHRDGYEVSTAGDGASALATLMRNRHDAVVLDVLMPEPGGLDVCRVIRARGVGAVVFGALAVVAAVIYPAVGANLRGQDDDSLVQVAGNAQTIAAKLKQSHTVGQLVPFGSTQLQILPDATVGPANGFVGVTGHDVQVAYGKAKPYFQNEAYGKVVYRIYTMQFPGQSGVLVRVARPASDATSTPTALGWLLALLVPVGAIGAAVLARLAAGRVLRPMGPLTQTVERIRATCGLARHETPGQDEISMLGHFAAMTAALDESAGAQRAGRRRLTRAAYPAHQPDHQPRTAR